MQKYILGLTQYCVRNGIIKKEEEDWFRYGIEKRLSAICVGIPFFLLAVTLTNFVAACSLYIGFFFLRTKTNGFHAKTVIGCLLVSLSLEVCICLILFPLLNWIFQLFLCIVCLVAVFKMAPVVHDNLPLTSTEIIRLRKESRSRVCLLIISIICTQYCGFENISNGLTMGLTMASIMLCFPYIIRKVRSKWKKLLKR